MRKTVSLALLLCIVFSMSALCVSAEDTVKELEFTSSIYSTRDHDISFPRNCFFVVIRTEEEFNDFLKVVGSFEFSTLKEHRSKLPEDFFETKCLFIVRDNGGWDSDFEITKCVIEDECLTLHYSACKSGLVAKETYLLFAELNKADIEGVKTVNTLLHRVHEVVEIENTEYAKLEFTPHYFDGELTGSILDNYNPGALQYGKKFRPVYIGTSESLDTFVSDYCVSENNEFVEFASSLPENYFDENALILTYASDEYTDINYEIMSIYGGAFFFYYESELIESSYGFFFDFSFGGGPELTVGEKNTIIVAEFKKSDIYNYESVTDESEMKYTIYRGTSAAIKKNLEGIIPDSPLFIRGDVDCDNELTATDYLYLKRIYFGTTSLNEFIGATKARSDIDINGKIEAIDYLLLKRAYFGTYTIE